jgi:hypothetical protein
VACKVILSTAIGLVGGGLARCETFCSDRRHESQKLIIIAGWNQLDVLEAMLGLLQATIFGKVTRFQSLGDVVRELRACESRSGKRDRDDRETHRGVLVDSK